MPEFSTLTKKGQVTIPVSIRKELGLEPKQRVAFVQRDDKRVEIKPATDFFALRGSIKFKKKYSDKKANKAIAEYFAKKYVKGHKSN